MSELLAILKYKSQQCQNEHTKSHKVFKVIVLHKHHLDSLREFWQCPPCNTIVYKNFIIKNENIQRTSCEVYCCMFFIFRNYTHRIFFASRVINNYFASLASSTALNCFFQLASNASAFASAIVSSCTSYFSAKSCKSACPACCISCGLISSQEHWSSRCIYNEVKVSIASSHASFSAATRYSGLITAGCAL